jgi:hypothetical protein
MAGKYLSSYATVGVLLLSLAAHAQQTSPAGNASGSNVTSSISQADSSVVPRVIQFSGTVKDPAGNPLAGTVSLTFSLYEDQEGGKSLWVETQTVELDNQGRYTVLLGGNSPNGLPLDLFMAGQARWLSIQPALPGAAELPRVLLAGVPYALKAADAETLGGQPASAYVLSKDQALSSVVTAAAPGAGSWTSGSQTGSAMPPTTCSSMTDNGTSSPATIAMFTANCTIGNSIITQTSSKLGIGLSSTPTALLDVNGSATVRGNQAIAGPSPWIDVTAPPYSADPTGTADAAAPITSAIGACSASSGVGCTVFIPAGHYKIGTNASQLSIAVGPSNVGVTLMGAGTPNPSTTVPGATTLVGHSATAPLISVSGGGTANVNGVTISNLGFIDDSAGNSSEGILMQDAQYFSLDEISCAGFSKGACIQLQGDGSSPNEVFTQFGSIKDLYVNSSNVGINAPDGWVSEVTVLGGNISCATAPSGSIGVNFTAPQQKHNGELQIYGTAVNDCATGFYLGNTGATHLVGKVECAQNDSGCATGVAVDTFDTLGSSNGNVITVQASKTAVGIQIMNSGGGSSNPPSSNQIVGGTFLSNTTDICVDPYALPSTLVLVPSTPDNTACSTGKLVPASQVPVSHLNQASGFNDVAGRVQLSASSWVGNFTTPFTSPPVCVATDATAAKPVAASATATTLTLTGLGTTDTDYVNYVCVGNPN